MMYKNDSSKLNHPEPLVITVSLNLFILGFHCYFLNREKYILRTFLAP